MVAAPPNAIEPEYGKHCKLGHVDAARRPRISSELAAWTRVRVRTEYPDACRVNPAVISDDISDDVIGERCRNLESSIMQAPGQMSGAEESLFFPGVERKDDGGVEPFGKPAREHPRQLDHRGSS